MAEYIVRVDEKRKLTDHPNDPLPWLLGLPALEEIIRCRDCKHMYSHFYKTLDLTDAVDYKCDSLFDAYGATLEVNPDGFCAWAERDK